MIINLNNPLANGTLINGVANFYTSTKPTARINGSALVVGDKWYNPSTGVDGFWNGTYWLSDQQHVQTGSSPFNPPNVTQHQFAEGAFYPNVFIETAVVSGAIANSPQDSTNYWTFTFCASTTTGFFWAILKSITDLNLSNYYYSFPVNVLVLNATHFDWYVDKIGAAGGFRRFSVSLICRRVL
jgi:hypothetical protein